MARSGYTPGSPELHPVAAGILSGMRDSLREAIVAQVLPIYDGLQTPDDWRRIEAIYAETELALERGNYDETTEELAGHDIAIEAAIFSKPAPDLIALRFKLRVFDPDFYGAEAAWDALRADIERYLPAGGARG